MTTFSTAITAVVAVPVALLLFVIVRLTATFKWVMTQSTRAMLFFANDNNAVFGSSQLTTLNPSSTDASEPLCIESANRFGRFLAIEKKGNCTESNNFPADKFQLKIGDPVMVLRNIDPINGLCNGTTGIVIWFLPHLIGMKIIDADGNPKMVLIQPRDCAMLERRLLGLRWFRRLVGAKSKKPRDELKQYIDSRYCSFAEVACRLFGYKTCMGSARLSLRKQHLTIHKLQGTIHKQHLTTIHNKFRI